MEAVKLNNGVAYAGSGTRYFRGNGTAECIDSVKDALALGYRDGRYGATI